MNVRQLARYIIIISFFTCMLPSVFGQAPLDLRAFDQPIILDGISDEPVWASATVLPMTTYQPVFGSTPSEQTEILVGYSADFMYLAGRIYDSDPDNIRANSLYRDQAGNDDVVTLLLDTYNDNENALIFWTNPAGVRGDYASSNDGRQTNTNWNTYWDVKTQRTNEGWFFEMRIPFSSLGFQLRGGEVTMGLIASRFIARKNERVTFPALSPELSSLTPSRAQKIHLSGVHSEKPIYMTPYFLTGVGREVGLNAEQTAYSGRNNAVRDLGLDIKYNVTSNLTIDATLNTDFAQVEADNQQINLTRFSLFFPEKRQFFQERAGIFQFGTIAFGPDRLFHSRRLGLHEGQAIPIIGGVRLVGKIDDWDVGLLDLQTAKSSSLDLPTENFGVLRLRRQVLNPYSYAGGMVTSRLGDDGSYNVAYGIDSNIRVFGDDYLTAKWAQTKDDDITNGGGNDFASSGLYQVQWNRRSNVGLNYWATFTRAGKDFQPEMGFTTRRDFTEAGWYISYDWLLKDHAKIRQISPIQFWGFVATRNEDGSVESALYEYDTDIQWKSGANLWMDLEVHYEDIRIPLDFPGNTTIPADNYTFFRAEGGGGLPPGKLFQPSLNWGLSSFYGGNRYDISTGMRWNISRYLELRGFYSYTKVRFPDRNQGFNAHITSLRIRMALNTRISLHSFMQYNNSQAAFITNLRFRYNFREGNDLWIVYNEGLNTDRNSVFPVLPLSNERTLLLKYTYTFGL